jgi:hypothetical protein
MSHLVSSFLRPLFKCVNFLENLSFEEGCSQGKRLEPRLYTSREQHLQNNVIDLLMMHTIFIYFGELIRA